MIKSFKCYKCIKSFRSNQHLKRHLTRKYPCKAVSKLNKKPEEASEKPYEAIRSQHIAKISQLQNNTINNDNGTQEEILENIENNTIVQNTNITIQDKFNCKYCNQEFKHRQSLSKHINNLRCEAMPLLIKNNILSQKKNKKVKELKERKISTINNINNTDNSDNSDNSNNTTNTNSNNNIDIDNSNSNNTTNNIININAFGKENLSSISQETKINILNKRYNGHPYLVKLIFFDIIENRNFFMPNKRDKNFVKIYDGSNMTYENKVNFIKIINNRLTEYSEQWSEECKDKIENKTHNSLKEMYIDYRNGVLNEEYSEIIDDFLMKYTDEIKKTIIKNKIKLENK